jgi:hypothetical protein
MADVNKEVGRDMNASKMRSECLSLANESYKCREKGDYDACKPYFERYKECKKAEHDRIVENRRKQFS